MLTMRYPTTEDVMTLSLNIRAMDALEMKCFSDPGETIVHRLGASVRASDGVLAVYDTDLKTCICIFGFLKSPDTESDIALIWCVGTNQLKEYPLQFVRWGRMFIAAIAAQFDDGVYNVVHQDNRLAKRWLRLCGCRVYPGADLEYKDEPFTWFSYPKEAA